MQNKFWIFQPFPSSLLPVQFGFILTLLLLFLLAPTALYAQSTAPTPIPLAPTNTLIAVAGGHGADLWDIEGDAPLQQIAPGERLVASKQSTDGQWLYVTTDTGMSGWAAADALIVFYRMALPTEAVTITPVTPTPLPTATVSGTADTGEAEASATVAPAVDSSTTTTTAVSALALTGDEPTARVNITTMRLNIRSGPGTNYPVIAKAESDQVLTLLGRNAEQSWVEVLLTEGTNGSGWVAAPYLTLSSSLADLPISTRVSTAPAQPAQANTTNVAVAPPTQQAAASGLHGKLVIQPSFGGPIYLYEFGSGQLRQLTTGFDPALSPDGSQVVFTRDGGEHGIYLINSDGSNEHKIFGERELLRSPKWSPDGQWIVFVRSDEFEDCRIYDKNGRCYRESAFPAPNPRDYPLGKERIAKLARIDRNGENYRDLATMEKAVAPDWNSSGVVYQSTAGLQITADRPDATTRELYFEIRKQYHQDPDWQPSGGRVVFQQRQGGHWQIFAINPDGSGLTALTRPATALVDTMPSSVAPAWSPDGQHIVFLSNRTENNDAGAWRLWVMNSDGSNQRPLPINLTFAYNYVLEQVVDWGP
ncbi:MAG: SH3 domain-containing protein [Caldilineaceae bacterium]